MSKLRNHTLLAATASGTLLGLYYLLSSGATKHTPLPRASTQVQVDRRAPDAVSPNPVSIVEEHPRSEPQYDLLSELKRQLDDPGQHEANLRQAMLDVEQRYGRLLQRIRGLGPEALARLKTALAERDLALRRGALPDHFPVDETASQSAKKNLERIRAKAEAQLHTLLGDEAYAQYTSFQQSEPYRETIEHVANMMRSRGIDVPDGMQDKILEGYTEALVAAANESAKDITPAALQALSDAARQELRIKEQSRFDEALALTMSKLLSSPEYKAFMECQLKQNINTP